MKRVSVTVLVSALLFALVAVGGTVTTKSCPPGCEQVCSPEECARCCGAAACANPATCTWDHSRWPDLQYNVDGSVKGALTADQARQVVNRYLIERGAAEVCIDGIEDTAATWTINAHTPHGEYQFTIAKKTAWLHQEVYDPGC